MFPNNLLPFFLITLIVSTSTVYGTDEVRTIDQAYIQAISGDVRPVLQFLEQTKESEPNKFTELSAKYDARFIEASEEFIFEDPFISKLHQYYRTYWRTSLMNPDSEEEYKNELKESLKVFLQEMSIEPTDFNHREIETELKRLAEERGYHLLLGKTSPFRELMIWKKEERIEYKVELPEESFSVNMVFLQDFICKGWLGYATFNEKHTAGWANNREIYRVGAKPEEPNEWFRVSLVGHEGRHVSDKRKYGSLPGWQLEYRAKLTELIIADQTFWKLINKFKNEAKPNKSTSHSHASYLLMEGFINNLNAPVDFEDVSQFNFKTYDVEDLKKIAEKLLNESTDSLENQDLT